MKHAALISTLAGCVLAICAGCQQETVTPVKVNHYMDSWRDLHQLKRVCFVEIAEDIRYPSVARSMTSSLHQEIQNAGLFHMTVMQRDDPVVWDLGLSEPRRYSMDEMARIRRTLNCDGVLFGRIVDAEFYPHTKITLHLVLLDLKKGRVGWAVDDTWDIRDEQMQARMVQWVCRAEAGHSAPDSLEIARMSPRIFQRFVAWEVAKTMAPPRSDRAQLVKYRQRLELYDMLENGL
ncbi:MAG: hypothetical protein ACOCZE_07180 [Planctomycetota bacterium]